MPKRTTATPSPSGLLDPKSVATARRLRGGMAKSRMTYESAHQLDVRIAEILARQNAEREERRH